MSVALLLAAVLAAAFPPLWRFTAHNAYPEKGQHGDRLERARRAGLRAVEIDVSWSEERRRAVITHEKIPAGGEPTLEQYFWKPLLPELERLPRGKPGWLLLVDFKTGHPGPVRELYGDLQRRSRLVSRFGSQIDYGPLTVLLTGDNRAIAAFEKLHPARGPYLAMGNREPPERQYRENLEEYFPEPPTAFYRVYNFEWSHIEPDRDARRNGPLPGNARDRLRAFAELARRKGYWLRTWTLNESTFGGRAGLLERWTAAREAGVQMIATDEYDLAAATATADARPPTAQSTR